MTANILGVALFVLAIAFLWLAPILVLRRNPPSFRRVLRTLDPAPSPIKRDGPNEPIVIVKGVGRSEFLPGLEALNGRTLGASAHPGATSPGGPPPTRHKEPYSWN